MPGIKKSDKYLIDYFINYKLLQENLAHDKETDKILSQIKMNLTWPKRKRLYVKYVALVVFLFSVGSLLMICLSPSNPVEENHNSNSFIEAELIQSDGCPIVLGRAKPYAKYNASSNGVLLKYSSDTFLQNTTKYNVLRTREGRTFKLQLSDGSKIWLNEKTSIRYPIVFTPNQTREVELLYGEAYFDVSHSSFHLGNSFNVKIKAQNIEVLGTEFNVVSDSENHKIVTTLVDGSISFLAPQKQLKLIPNQQIDYNVKTGAVILKKVNAFNVAAWHKGLFNFNNQPIGDILKKLSSWYGFSLIVENTALKNVRFSGALKKDQPLEELLKKLNEASDGQINYDVNGTQLIVN